VWQFRPQHFLQFCLEMENAPMRMSWLLLAPLVLASAALSGCADEAEKVPLQARESPQQQVVDKSRLAVLALRSNEVVGRPVNEELRKARGVLIFPNLVRAGVIVGAGGGVGVLLGRIAGGWSDPAFYFSGEGSFGLQIGVEAGQVMFVIRNDAALTKIVNGNVNLGVDVSVAIGPLGGGAAGGTTSNLSADLVAFSVQEGIFGGAAFKGGVINPMLDWDEAYYGIGATPRGIVLENRLHNPGAPPLKAALAIR
jgi:lipid-binding SYLF domain-containing protein